MLYDSPSDLNRFSRRHKLTLSLVSDQGSVVIKDLGLLNEEMPKDTQYFGVPYPGIFLLDGELRVVDKFAEKDYRDRPVIEDLVKAVNALGD